MHLECKFIASDILKSTLDTARVSNRLTYIPHVLKFITSDIQKSNHVPNSELLRSNKLYKLILEQYKDENYKKCKRAYIYCIKNAITRCQLFLGDMKRWSFLVMGMLKVQCQLLDFPGKILNLQAACMQDFCVCMCVWDGGEGVQDSNKSTKSSLSTLALACFLQKQFYKKIYTAVKKNFKKLTFRNVVLCQSEFFRS